MKAIRFSLFWLFETISLCCLCLSLCLCLCLSLPLSLPLSLVYLSSILNHVFQSPFLRCDLAQFFHERIWVRILTPPHVVRNNRELGFGWKKIFLTLTLEIFYTPKPINLGISTQTILIYVWRPQTHPLILLHVWSNESSRIKLVNKILIDKF